MAPKLVLSLFLVVALWASECSARRTLPDGTPLASSMRISDNDSKRHRKCLAADTAATDSSSPDKICFERISDIPAVYFQTHPGRPHRAVVATQAGLLTFISVPLVGSRKSAKAVCTWLNLTSKVDASNPETGLLSFAFHPKFVDNGRFFVSYICNAKTNPDCTGWCACNNSTTGCTLGQSGAGCDSKTIIDEYRAVPRNGSYKTSRRVRSWRRRRLLAFGRPFANHNGGHIFFGKDGYLYYTSGDGGGWGDPFNFAQSTDTFLGKILRIDVDGPRASNRNYGIPKSNPFVGRQGIAPEIFALGFRNPWRCDQDHVTGYIICGDVGQDTVEEIDIIRPGRNYMWHNFEGTLPYKWAPSPSIYIPENKMVGKKTWPIFEYLHQCNKLYPDIDCVEPGYVAVTGGVVYRAQGKNKCLQGKYLYNDVSGPMWLGTIYTSQGQNRSSQRVTPICTDKTPLQCFDGDPAIGSIWSWGKDAFYNAYALGNMGIHRIVPMSMCGISC